MSCYEAVFQKIFYSDGGRFHTGTACLDLKVIFDLFLVKKKFQIYWNTFFSIALGECFE